MSILIAIVGILVLVGIAWLMSNDKKHIQLSCSWYHGSRSVAYIAWFMLNTSIGQKVSPQDR